MQSQCVNIPVLRILLLINYVLFQILMSVCQIRVSMVTVELTGEILIITVIVMVVMVVNNVKYVSNKCFHCYFNVIKIYTIGALSGKGNPPLNQFKVW